MHTLSQEEELLLKRIINPHSHHYRYINFDRFLASLLRSIGVKDGAFNREVNALLHINNFNTIKKNPIYEGMTASLFIFGVLVTLLHEIKVLDEKESPMLLINIARCMVNTLLEEVKPPSNIDGFKKYLFESILLSLRSQVRSAIPKQFLIQIARHHQMECGVIFGKINGRGLEATKNLLHSSPIFVAKRGEELLIFKLMFPLIERVVRLHPRVALEISGQEDKEYRVECNKKFNAYFMELQAQVGCAGYSAYPGASITFLLKITLPYLMTGMACIAWQYASVDQALKWTGNIMGFILGLTVLYPAIHRYGMASFTEFKTFLRGKLEEEKAEFQTTIAEYQKMQVVMSEYNLQREEIKDKKRAPFVIEFTYANNQVSRANSPAKLLSHKKSKPCLDVLKKRSAAGLEERHRSKVPRNYLKTRHGQYIKFPHDLAHLCVTREDPRAESAIASIATSSTVDVHRFSPKIVRRVDGKIRPLEYKLKRKNDNTRGRIFVSLTEEKVIDDGKEYAIYRAECYSPNGGHNKR